RNRGRRRTPPITLDFAHGGPSRGAYAARLGPPWAKSRVMGGVRRRPLFLACLVVLAGCGGGSDVAVPPGFTVRAVEKPAFTIALPKSWRSFGDNSHTSAKSVAGGN